MLKVLRAATVSFVCYVIKNLRAFIVRVADHVLYFEVY